MASYGQAVPPSAHRPANYAAPYAAPASMAPPAAPAGTFSPGTKIQVGNHRVVIQKYLSEGGFAHVYLVKLQTPVNGTDQAVLKRVAVPDKESLRGMRTEVETMKRLKGHKAIVTYIDSHASELRGGGYEVFLLMEYCNGGGLIDFMNTRLQHRLTEPEILNIFADVAEGVACMHYLRPPLLHRDLKVENVLITMVGSTRKFKLCDFGSAAPPRPAPTTVVECRLMDEDVQKHTTMQYRSPEMIDVYRKQPIDEKSDIWALGVLLYKLCYYTTPFEDQGQLAILNASYKFPSYPVFSDRLKGLIGWMLRENPQLRPNIYQVLREACAMQGREPPVKDIYSGRPQVDQQRLEQPQQDPRSPPTVGAVFSPQAVQQQQVIPEVERMRRGRLPAAQSSPQPNRPNPSPGKVTNGDPFAALDARPSTQGGDELSSRFPTLDQFALLHDKGQKFDFDSGSSVPSQQTKDLSQRVAERLADEAFQVKTSPAPVPAQASQRQSVDAKRANVYPTTTSDPSLVSPPLKSTSAPPKHPEISRASAIISSSPELRAISSQASQPLYQPTPKPVMVSTGTMTSPIPDQPPQFQVQRFPTSERHRAASLPRSPVTATAPSALGDGAMTSRTGARTTSFQGSMPSAHTRYPSSSRPSLEGGRPSLEPLDTSKTKPRVVSKPRPISTHLESNLAFLRERESNPRPSVSPGLPSPGHSREKSLPPSPTGDDERNIESNVEFLRSLEDSDQKKRDRGSKHMKRGSLSSLSAGAKGILSGKFGDAFKRFEGNSSGPPGPRTPSPLKDLERRELTPIAGSETMDGRSDDGQVRDLLEDDGEYLTPEMRREKEARMLAQEEARVAAAQAEYRQRLAAGSAAGGGGAGAGVGAGQTPLPKSIGGVSRAVSIQNKVQSLIDESNRSSAGVTRTAQGYGHYADSAHVRSSQAGGGGAGGDGRPPVPRKPGVAQVTGGTSRGAVAGQQQQQQRPAVEPSATGRTTASTAAAAGRPMAPPKPTRLGMNPTAGGGGGGGGNLAAGGRAGSPPKTQNQNLPLLPANRTAAGLGISVPKIRPAGGVGGSGSVGPDAAGTEALLAVDLPGQGPTLLEMTAAEKDDYISNFQKRYPSLSAIEMVERDLAAEEAQGRR